MVIFIPKDIFVEYIVIFLPKFKMADKSPPIDFQENRSLSTNSSHKIRNSLFNLVNINRGKSFTLKITGRSYKIEKKTFNKNRANYHRDAFSPPHSSLHRITF